MRILLSYSTETGFATQLLLLEQCAAKLHAFRGLRSRSVSWAKAQTHYKVGGTVVFIRESN